MFNFAEEKSAIRLECAVDLLERKVLTAIEKGQINPYLNLDDVNEILAVAGYDSIKRSKEIQLITTEKEDE